MELDAYRELVGRHRVEILEAERWLWRHPETGYREWETQGYLAGVFEAAGYTLRYAGDIPGFYAELDTGRPGPRVLIMGEMDALLVPGHPESVDGRVHACGHNAQCAALIGAALALREPGALDGLCGSIRLMAVPAEEMIELEYREELRRRGVIKYYGGKTEFLRRGYMDGCDIAFLNHVRTGVGYPRFDFNDSNGFMTKTITFKGRAAHAGGSPHKGVNALYSASLALSAINALRETFRDEEHIRVHPIMTEGGSTVNSIPARAVLSTYVRGATLEAIEETSRKVNRAAAAGALALGAGAEICDRPGYSPLLNDPGLKEAAREIMSGLVGAENVVELPWGAGSTDMGDLSCVMRTLHPHVSGASGHAHGDDFRITDPETCCVLSAAAEVMLAASLLSDGAARAKRILSGSPPRYADKEAYLAAIDRFIADRELVSYREDGAEIAF